MTIQGDLPSHPAGRHIDYYNRGTQLLGRGNLAEAIACYLDALKLVPDFIEAHHNLGVALHNQGRLTDAISHYQRAIQLKPDYTQAHNNLGNAFSAMGRSAEAIACLQRALEIEPGYAEAYNNLGAVYLGQGKLDEATACFQRALALDPKCIQAHNNLGNAWKDQGDFAQATASYRRALDLDPNFTPAHNNLLYTIIFNPNIDPKTSFEEHRRWSQQHAEPLKSLIKPHANEKSPDRRLRIGYVSPDFRSHPVGRFMLPLLQAHDHTRFEIICYAHQKSPDKVTERCQAHADVWREIYGLTDEAVADMVRRDGIDILVDLTMHMDGSRLLVFARKPAPVQVTYLAYCGTTGLDTIDYRLTDPYLDPPGQNDAFYSEKSIYLPETYWCYQPVAQTPEVNALPALRTGYITFGCLNNFWKVTQPTLEAWAKILQEVPDAHLLLHAYSGKHRQRVQTFFAQQGIAAERLHFADRMPSAEYFRIYERIDIALDPFPYGGGTTTCDALWMGVPVITLAGQTAVGRGGLSILSNAGLPNLVAHNLGQYVRNAVQLAQDAKCAQPASPRSCAAAALREILP